MRLVIDGRRLGPERTGVGRYLETLLAGWWLPGAPLREAVLVLHDPRGAERVPPVDHLKVVTVGAGWPGVAWERWGLGRVLRPDDVLFAPTNLLPAGWRGRSVLVLHDLIAEVLPDGFPWHVRWRFNGRYHRSARRADRVIVPSETTARDAARLYGVGADRLRVIRPAVDRGFRPRHPDGPEVAAARRAVGLGDVPYFLFVGKRSARRNVPALLDAFDRHRRHFSDHRLVFVGPRGAGTPVAGRPGVIEAGHVDEPTLCALLGGAIALVYPSEYEGFGLPIAEALACHCPVVTLRRGAMAEAGGDAALYVPEASAEAVQDALHHLAINMALRADLARRSLSQAAHPTPPEFAEQVAEVIREVAGVSHGIYTP